MNIKQLDIKRIVAASKNLEKALDDVEGWMKIVNEIIKTNVEKDGRLNYLYDEK